MVIFSHKPRSVIYTKQKVAQLCPTLCVPMDCTVHEILQPRILDWVAIPFSRGNFPTQGSKLGLHHCRQILYHWATWETHLIEDKLLFYRSFIENYKYIFSKLAFETMQGICMRKWSWELFHLLCGKSASNSNQIFQLTLNSIDLNNELIPPSPPPKNLPLFGIWLNLDFLNLKTLSHSLLGPHPKGD